MADAAIKTTRHPNVDSGWAWVVLVGCCFTNMILGGFVYTVGIFNVIFLDVYQQSRQTTAWVGAIQTTSLCLWGPLIGLISNKIGFRMTGMLGGMTGALGLILTYQAQSFVHLFITFGFILGFGLSLSYLPIMVCIGFYFQRYRHIAFCIVGSSAGVGVILLPPIITYSADQYGWRGCMLIMAGVYLHIVAATALIWPQAEPPAQETDVTNVDDDVNDPVVEAPDWLAASMLSLTSVRSGYGVKHAARTPRLCENETGARNAAAYQSLCELRLEDQQSITHSRFNQFQFYSHGDLSRQGEKSIEMYSGCHKNPRVAKGFNNWQQNDLKCTEENRIITEDHGICNLKHTEDKQPPVSTGRKIISVLTNKYLVLLSMNVLCVNASAFICYMHFPDSFYRRGMQQSEMAVLMMLLGSCNIICRLLAGAITNSKVVSVLMTYISGGGITSIFILLCPVLSHTTAGRVIFAIGFGLYNNTYNALLPPLTLELCCLDELSFAYGVQLLSCGIGGLLGPPFAGWIFDVTGNYTGTFLVAGCLYLFGSLLLMAIPVMQGRDARAQEHECDENGRIDRTTD